MQISEVSSEQSAASDISNDQSCLPLQKLDKLVAELKQMAPMLSPEIVQKIRNLIPTFPSQMKENQRFRLWKLSYSIWNLCVELSNRSGQSVCEEHAKLRHIASDLLVVAGSVGGVHSSLVKTAFFFFTTGTIWHKLENYVMAAACFEKATELSNTAKDHRQECGTLYAETEEDDKFLFRLYVARAQTAWELSQKALVRSLLSRARGMLKLASCSPLTEMYEELAQKYLHYGKLLLAKEEKQSQAEAISLLEQAYDICSEGVSAVLAAASDSKDNNNMDLVEEGREVFSLNSLKFKILRYLAAGHLQNKNYESVLKCVDSLKSGPDHASTPFLALQAYVGLKRFDEAEKEAYILVAQRSTPFDICAGAIDVLIESSAGSSEESSRLLLEAVKKAFSIAHIRFPSNKEFVVRVLDKLLTQPLDQHSKKRVEIALSIAMDEKVISSLNEDSSTRVSATVVVSGSEDETYNSSAQECVYALLWNSGHDFFGSKDYATSIRLFEASLMYLSSDETSYTLHRAKSLRVLCICHLALGQYDRASEYIDESNKLEPGIAGVFLKFKLFLQTNDEEGAAKQVEEMFKCPDFEPDYLTLASHEAISCKCISVAIAALSRMLEQSSSRCDTAERKEAVIIRNIIVLSSQDAKHASMALKYFKLARSRLSELGSEGFFGSGSIEEKEAQWYAHSAWNQALDAAKSQNWALSAELFLCAADFYEVLSGTLENLDTRMVSMMLAVGAMLSDSREDANSNAMIKEAAHYLEKCRKLQEILRSKNCPSPMKDMTEMYLNLLLFEVKRRLHDPKAQLDIICRCSTLPSFPPNIFFTMGSSNQEIEVSMAAFEACINLTLASPTPDYTLVAASIRKLITLADSFRRDSPKALSLYKQAHQILLGLPVGVYPKDEVQWLISTAWNRASLHVRFNRFSIAEKWMNLALDMLKHLPAMESFRPTMLKNLSEVLKRKAVGNPAAVDD